MRSLLVLPLVLCLPLLLLAEDKKPDPGPNSLTDREAKEGWLVLFDGESTLGWKIDGEAKVKDGALVIGGDKAAVATVTTTFESCQWQLEHADLEGTGEARVSFFGVSEGGAKVGSSHIIRPPTGAKRWHHATGSHLGDNSRAFTVATRVSVHVPAGARVSLRGIKLRPTNGQALFNGKDLAGWKKFTGEPKREKSDYTVTKEGWLNVKNGPGDLQTEKLFGDFVLQLECISNGKHLNSGIFFRAIPGKYWQGYECQIRNQFTEKPTQKYTLVEFDPRTHKQVGKKTIQSTAVDYGTGAIYNRVPARKAVAKDGEWFTMTIAARGRHLATWINGIQQVDWTDNRPAGDNARNGYRAAPGAISIQGHDKTTDLSFRNIRIAELPREKKE
jgi:hypothetical protein